MAGNSFGQLFRITTFGESHGPAIGVVIDGVPPGVPLDESDINLSWIAAVLAKQNHNPATESDRGEILSGVFDGKTTGALAILIRNEDQRSQDYSDIKDVFRPGHADYTYLMKYGLRDYRGGGRSSGRETACRVAAGAVAKKILNAQKIKIIAYTLSVADITAKTIDYEVIEKNMVRAPDLEAAEAMIQEIERARKECDSLGGVVEAVVKGCPIGLGDPVFDKINARLAYALMSIGTIRGIEFGDGFSATKLRASEHNDPFAVAAGKIYTKTNHAGGILGGITNGDDIILRVAVKPRHPSRKSNRRSTRHHSL